MSSPTPSAALAAELLANLRHSFRSYQQLADTALARLSPEEWLWRPEPESNSAAVIVQHLVGNLRSRFTDFWTADGEKPDRQRDREFEEPATAAGVEALRQQWAAAWPLLWAVFEHLEQYPEDWLRPVTIRQEPHTALAALQRQATHYAYHTGQLVLLAKARRGAGWLSLSIPRGQSEQFNAQMLARHGASANLAPGSGV
ncbi:DUF1572 domain-containing protein [Hymenobacter gummosus]|uniref:DUF1572 domain-containing protein n=1 Tax=Hymenobacter gummosus TaxID=1776032 RepID=A0A431TZA7_9BACT|nr:DUF1572 family protein [Hymenobacter gummosus]RTQ47784.1 DUF1572 domain-containing protein [Hymenobacter gummosus]